MFCCGYNLWWILSEYMRFIYPYPSGLIHLYWCNHIIAPGSIPMKQPSTIWVNSVHNSSNHSKTQQVQTVYIILENKCICIAFLERSPINVLIYTMRDIHIVFIVLNYIVFISFNGIKMLWVSAICLPLQFRLGNVVIAQGLSVDSYSSILQGKLSTWYILTKQPRVISCLLNNNVPMTLTEMLLDEGCLTL